MNRITVHTERTYSCVVKKNSRTYSIGVENKLRLQERSSRYHCHDFLPRTIAVFSSKPPPTDRPHQLSFHPICRLFSTTAIEAFQSGPTIDPSFVSAHLSITATNANNTQIDSLSSFTSTTLTRPTQATPISASSTSFSFFSSSTIK